MLKELEDTIKDHGTQIEYLNKVVAKLQASSTGVQKITYTVKEAAEAIGVKETTIRTWIANEELEAIKTGKFLLIPVQNLVKYLNELSKKK